MNKLHIIFYIYFSSTTTADPDLTSHEQPQVMKQLLVVKRATRTFFYLHTREFEPRTYSMYVLEFQTRGGLLYTTHKTYINFTCATIGRGMTKVGCGNPLKLKLQQEVTC
jgi:hypothetical protein